LSLALLFPGQIPLVIVAITSFNLMFTFFLAWGLSMKGTTLAGIGGLAALVAWLAAAFGSSMVLRTQAAGLESKQRTNCYRPRRS
jgi:hypothetical protein